MLRASTLLLLLLLSNLVTANELVSLKEKYKRPDSIPFPEDNPYSAVKAALGKMLFFDPRLSKYQNLSCASCHNPSFGWEGALPRSAGSENTLLDRHNPTSLNMAWGTSFFWDGRAKTLEEQALGPIQSDVEMGMQLELLEMRLKNIDGYKKLFKKVFNGDVSANNIAKAIATFERTVVSGLSSFNKWVDGDEAAISEDAKKGFIIFNKKGRCADCHSGWDFTDNEFHDIGLETDDVGRYKIDSSSPKNMYAFKTPGLRNINQRSPYSIETLPGIILHYITGGIKRPSLSDKMHPLLLNKQEIFEITEFLETLQGHDKPMSLPTLPL